MANSIDAKHLIHEVVARYETMSSYLDTGHLTTKIFATNEIHRRSFSLLTKKHGDTLAKKSIRSLSSTIAGATEISSVSAQGGWFLRTLRGFQCWIYWIHSLAEKNVSTASPVIQYWQSYLEERKTRNG